MRGTALAPEVLRARRLVRAVVVCDVGCVTAGMTALLMYVPAIQVLVLALVATVPVLVSDSGAWNLRPLDLRWRTGIGVVEAVLVFWVRVPRSIDSTGLARVHAEKGPVAFLFSAFALLCALSVPVCLYALFTLRRHPVAHYQPAHRGGGGGAGKAAISATAAPPTSGFPTGWVGRRRFF
jgi:hypothetical protein